MVNVEQFLQIDFKQMFLWFTLILMVSKTLLDTFNGTIGKLIKKLGIETKSMREKREEHELLVKTAANLAKLQEKHEKYECKLQDDLSKYREQSLDKQDNIEKRFDEIAENINILTRMFIDKQINDYRWEIINLANNITDNKPTNKDTYQHCFRTYERYEKILEENNLENGEVELSMDIVNESYKRKLLKGF